MHVGVLCHALRSEITGKKIVAIFVAEEEGDVVLITHTPKLTSELHRVAAPDQRKVVSKINRVVLVDSGMTIRIRLAAHEVADIEDRHTTQSVLRRTREPGNAQLLSNAVP